MRSLASTSRLLTIPLLTLLGYSCASPAGLDLTAKSAAGDFHELVALNVTDPNRRAQATALTARMQRQIATLFTRIATVQGDLLELNADYDTTLAQINAKMAEASGVRTDTSEQLIRLVLDLRKQTTAEEWYAIQEGMTAYRED